VYIAEDIAGTIDTISVKISDNDTLLIFNWIVTIINELKLQVLPRPELISPTGGNFISEEDDFIWRRDSLSFFNDSTLTFIIQIAEDSLFSNILTTDSSIADTSVKLSEISGFEKIGINEKYYWRVKAYIPESGESLFAECRQSFSYYPLFAELVKFYYEKTSEGKIILYWQTIYERNNLGFNIYRSKSMGGDFIKVNKKLIKGERTYTFSDKTVEVGQTYFFKLEDVSLFGKTKRHPAISVTTPVPKKCELFPNYPNPFNVSTSFKYQITARTHVVIEIFNVLGRKIRVLVNEIKEPGFYSVGWDGHDNQDAAVVSGIYFYHMSTNSFRATRKMTVVR